MIEHPSCAKCYFYWQYPDDSPPNIGHCLLEAPIGKMPEVRPEWFCGDGMIEVTEQGQKPTFLQRWPK